MRPMLIVLGLTLATGAPAGTGGPLGQASPPSAGRVDSAQARYMRAHLNQAMTVHAAVIRGDLAAVAPAARALADLDDSRFPTGAPGPIADMKAAARRAAAAGDVLTAARSTAEMLNACGTCHRTIGTRPVVPASEPPDVGGVVGHMIEHQAAADQLLQGLVIPSDAAWRAGARALMTAPLNPRELPVSAEIRRQLAPTEARIHRLATEAVQATDPQSRADFYGQVLAGCADCHKLHAKLWGPKPKPR